MSLTNEDLIKIDKALGACGELTMTSKEERWLEYKKESVSTDCDIFRIAQVVIVQRDKNRTRKSESLTLIVELAAADGCDLEVSESEKKAVIVPLFCGGVI